MSIKRINCFLSILAITMSVVAVISLTMMNNYKAEVTETALSLCAMTIKNADLDEQNTESVKNLLTFADLSDICKQNIIYSVKNNSENLDKIVSALEYFEYSHKNIKNLERISEEQTASTIKLINKNITSEELAAKLINDIYDDAKFEKQVGNGNDYLVRYYCSNICIDACSDGTVRFLNDVAAKSSNDPFQEWLFDEMKINIIEETEIDGVIHKTVEGDLINAYLCINPENNRVFAAQITIKYPQQ